MRRRRNAVAACRQSRAAVEIECPLGGPQAEASRTWRSINSDPPRFVPSRCRAGGDSYLRESRRTAAGIWCARSPLLRRGAGTGLVATSDHRELEQSPHCGDAPVLRRCSSSPPLRQPDHRRRGCRNRSRRSLGPPAGVRCSRRRAVASLLGRIHPDLVGIFAGRGRDEPP